MNTFTHYCVNVGTLVALYSAIASRVEVVASVEIVLVK